MTAMRGFKVRMMAMYAVAAFALPGCQGPAPVMVDRARLVIDGPVGGRLQVRGLQGAVLGSAASTVTLTVRRDTEAAAPSASRYRLQHFGAGLAVHSTYAVVDGAGGFGEVTLGTEDRAVLPGDELVFTLYQGLAQRGFMLTMPVTWRP